MNIADAILTAGLAAAPAVCHAHDVLTYGRLRDEARRVGNRLLAEGLAKGDRVGLLAENGTLFVTAYLGIVRAGLCAVPLPPDISDKTLRRVIQSTRIQRVIASPRLLAKIAPLAAETGVGVLDVLAPSPAERANITPHAIDPLRDLAAIMLTSGSSGEPKGVMVTHENIAANTRDILGYMNLTAADRVMVVLPFCYCYGMSLLHTHLMAGASLVINNRFLFPEKVLDEMALSRCTGLAGVPSTYQILLRKTSFARRQFPSLGWLQQAGGRLPEPLVRELRQAFPDVRLYLMYGQTEATARLSYLPPERLDAKPGSIGRGLPGTRLEVLRPDGTPVAAGSGEVGEILAAGPNISSGYWEEPEETARYFRDGKLYTGDMARVDEDGFLYIVDRARDFIKSLGNRVSPKEIEDVLAEMPEVVEAAVIGVPHEIWGEAVKAFVVCRTTGQLTAEDVQRHCRGQLPNYKVPEFVEFLPALPKTAHGKVAKEELKHPSAHGEVHA